MQIFKHLASLLCGVAVGYAGMHLLLRADGHGASPGRPIRLRQAGSLALRPQQLSPPPPAPTPPPTPLPEPALAEDRNTSLFGECVARVAAGDTSPDDIVLAVLTTHKRHDLIHELRKHWLRDVKALLLTDRPGLSETERHKVVVYEGDPNCGAADRGAPALYHANRSWWGEYKWIIMVDDDVIVSTENLAAFLSAYEPEMPLWFSAHGCVPEYVPAGRTDEQWPHGAPCVARRAPSGMARELGRGRGLKELCEQRGDTYIERDEHGYRGGCGAVQGVEGLKTFGAEPGQSYCGGTGCVFSVGFFRSFPPTEVFRKHTMCQGCTRGQQDVALSRCLFHHHPAATAPIGVTGFFWGRPADRLVEQMLKFYPECAEGGSPLGMRRQRCVRQQGLLDWFSAHLQIRGAFTTLYQNLTPATWAGMFRHDAHMLVNDMLRSTHAHYEETAPLRARQRLAWATRTCCALVHRALVGCSFGCAPFRMRPMPRCHADAAALARLHGGDGRRGGRRRRRRASGDAPGAAETVAGGGGGGGGGAASFDPALWWSAEPPDAEAGPLKNHHKQFWPNGVMRCEFCGGWFNGWRGY